MQNALYTASWVIAKCLKIGCFGCRGVFEVLVNQRLNGIRFVWHDAGIVRGGADAFITLHNSNLIQTDYLPMKLIRLFVVLSVATVALGSVSCKRQGPAERVGEKIDDALDRRPAEGVRDAVEELKK